MLPWRQHKRAMRRTVHQVMAVPALLLARIGATTGIAITVNGPYTKSEMKRVGDGEGSGWAEREDTQPRLKFNRLELQQKNLTLVPKKTIISIEPGEAYRIATTKPADDEFVIAEVEPLTAEEANGLPIPEAA